MPANLPKRVYKALLFSLLGCSLFLATSCASIGSRAIKGERVNFNAALQQTADEQLLLNLVRLRYRDPPAFLEVTSISTQSQFQTSFEAGTELERATVNSDLFKITGGFGYFTQPTLTYTPLQGENFIQRLLSPLTVDKLMLLYRSGWNISRLFRLCVQRRRTAKKVG